MLEPRMLRYQFLPRCRRWLKCCDWAAPKNWFTNCGHNSRWLPIVWTLTWHGLAMRCWLVIFLFYVSKFPCALAYWCCVFADHFERDHFERNPACFLVCSVRWGRMDSAASNLKSTAQRFDLRLMKCCLQRTAASVFGSLDPFSMTEFAVNRLKGAETRDWMASNDLSMPGLVNEATNIVGLCPLVVSNLKKISRKVDGGSVVVSSSIVGVLFASLECTVLLLRRRGWTGICITISLLVWNWGCFIFFWKSVSIIIIFPVWYMLVRSGSGSVPQKFLGTH